MRQAIQPALTRALYTIGDGSMVGRGDLVDWSYGEAKRARGSIVVIEGSGAWVQFPELGEPCKYPLHELRRPAAPDFRAFYAERHGEAWPAPVGTPHAEIIRQLADALADYADMLRDRA